MSEPHSDPHPKPDLESLPDDRPEMTHREASFHTAVAGSRAAKEAAANGNDPNQVEAIGELASGGKTIGGVTFHRPSAKSAFAVPAVAKLFEGADMTHAHEKGIYLYCFHDAPTAYRLACIDKDEAARTELLAKGEELMLALDEPETIEAALEWCTDAFLRLNGVKKPSRTPEPTTPAAVAPTTPQASPPSPEPETGAEVPAGSSSSSTS